MTENTNKQPFRPALGVSDYAGATIATTRIPTATIQYPDGKSAFFQDEEAGNLIDAFEAIQVEAQRQEFLWSYYEAAS
jgi:hypothetical protein